MANFLEKALQRYPRPYITDGEIEAILQSTTNSRYSKVKRFLADGKLLHIRRGLYCITDKVGYSKRAHPYELAQYVYGPSCISLESALSFHQLIPEMVYTITSVTVKRPKKFQTPLGCFRYLHLPLENFYTEIELIQEDDYQFFMAKPWRAICDYVFCYRTDCRSLEQLLDSLRIDPEHLPTIRSETIQLLDEYYHHSKISRFLKDVSQ